MFTCELQSKDGTCGYFYFTSHALAVNFGMLMAKRGNVVFRVYAKSSN